MQEYPQVSVAAHAQTDLNEAAEPRRTPRHYFVSPIAA